jgi:hypothetical protein
MFADEVSYIGHFVSVFPNPIEQIYECSRRNRLIHPVDHVGDCISLLVTQIYSREAVQRHIYGFSFGRLHAGKLLHGSSGAVRTEISLASNPICAFLRDGPLRKLILEAKLKVRSKKSLFFFRLGNMKLSQLPPCFVGDFTRNESWSGEDELERFDLFELMLQCLIGVNGEARCCDCNFRARNERPFQIISDEATHIV